MTKEQKSWNVIGFKQPGNVPITREELETCFHWVERYESRIKKLDEKIEQAKSERELISRTGHRKIAKNKYDKWSEKLKERLLWVGKTWQKIEGEFIEIEDDNIFSKCVKKMMNEYEITQTEIAELLGVSKMTVNRWLKGGRGISVDHLLKIAEVCEFKIQVVLVKK